MNKDTDANIPKVAPDCFSCRHFKITWEPAFPRACMAFGMKCRNLPSMEVYLSTGKHCIAFTAKAAKENQTPDR